MKTKIKKNINPLVSIIMNCHNGEKYLKDSLKSVINQNYKNWELIFFDNQSDDNSIKIVKEFDDHRIKNFSSNKLLNLYAARNFAINKAKGKYICFCDTDDWWIKNKLEKQIKLIKKLKKIKIIFSNLYFYYQKTKKRKLYFNKMKSLGNFTQELLNDYKLGILTVMVDKSIFKKNKFNKKFNIIGDFDFFLNLSLKEEFYCSKEPLAYYRVHEHNYSKNLKLYAKELKYWISKNYNKFNNKNYSLKKIKFYLHKIRLKNFFLGAIAHW